VIALHARLAWGVDVVTVNQPWLHPAPAGGSAGVFLILGSSTGARLVGARSSDGEVSLMRGKARATEIDVPPGEPLALTQAGPHLLVRKLNRRVVLGDHVSLTLTLRDAQGGTQDIPVQAEVRHRSPIDDERRAHGAHKH
jgi:copper(I)-binding protein